MKEIKLSRNKSALVDNIDLDLSIHAWYCSRQGYACRDTSRFPRHVALMHRVILERKLNRKLLKGEECDHINGNPLDNRRDNLRACSHSQNLKNQNRRSTNTSGYTGVSYFGYDSRSRKWNANIKVNYKSINLGYYATAEEAARAYDKAAREYFGKFARLNFPE